MSVWYFALFGLILVGIGTVATPRYAAGVNAVAVLIVIATASLSVVVTAMQIERFRAAQDAGRVAGAQFTVSPGGLPASPPTAWPTGSPLVGSTLRPLTGAAAPAVARNPYSRRGRTGSGE